MWVVACFSFARCRMQPSLIRSCFCISSPTGTPGLFWDISGLSAESINLWNLDLGFDHLRSLSSLNKANFLSNSVQIEFSINVQVYNTERLLALLLFSEYMLVFNFYRFAVGWANLHLSTIISWWLTFFCFFCSIATLQYQQEDGVFDDICHIDIIPSMVSQELKERAIKSISL
jgi:hypothetical protein